MESILNQRKTQRNLYAAKVVQQYYVICMILRWVGIHNTQQHIYWGDIIVFLPDDLAFEIAGR